MVLVTSIKNIVDEALEGKQVGSINKNASLSSKKAENSMIHQLSSITTSTQYTLLKSLVRHFGITKTLSPRKASAKQQAIQYRATASSKTKEFSFPFRHFQRLWLAQNNSTPSRERLAQLCPSPTLLSSKQPLIFWLNKLFQSLQVKDTQVNCKYAVAVSSRATQVTDFPFSHFDLCSRHT